MAKKHNRIWMGKPRRNNKKFEISHINNWASVAILESGDETEVSQFKDVIREKNRMEQWMYLKYTPLQHFKTSKILYESC